MTLEELLRDLDRGHPLVAGTAAYSLMVHYSEEARKICAQINGPWRDDAALRELMGQLTGCPVPESFRLFPPFYTDFGKNIRFGEGVFVNSCCCFQDQGGIRVGDGCLIGHRVTIATINHGLRPEERHVHHVAPVIIRANVWIGSSSTLLPGVEIGEGSIIAAGSVVSRSVPPRTVVGGVPARLIRHIE